MITSIQAELLRSLEEKLPSEIPCQVKIIVKNNGAEHLAVCRAVSGDMQLSPLIYLESFAARAEEGESIDLLAGEMAELIQGNAPADLPVSWISDFREAEGRIVFRLINRELNGDEIPDLPGREWLDLYISYGVLLQNGQEGLAMAQVKRTMLERWGVTEEELYRKALENTTRLLPDRLYRMGEYLEGLLPGLGQEEAQADDLYILTNTENFYGASAVLYTARLRLLAKELGRDVFLIPSSIHEFVIFTDESKLPGIREMIREVNATQVPPEEILGEECYRVYAETGETVIEHCE